MELFAALRMFDCLYAVPLILATGMVYSASRHENFQEVIHGGLRLSAWIAGFLLAILFLMILIF